jgi:putative Holliday junction resolvase
VRPGRRLAIDVGKARIGIAISDFHGILASPVSTLDRILFEANPSTLVASIEEFESLLEIYVGLPLNLQGAITASTEDAVAVARTIGELTSLAVLLVDERLTTSISNVQLKELGKTQKQARGSIDQMAAVAILEYALQVERNSGLTPGVLVSNWSENNE